VKTWLLGSGWWTVWHLFLLGMLLPVAGLVWWLSIYKPGAGPQGGELGAGLLILFLLGWTLATLVHAMLLAGTFSGGWTRYLKALLAWGLSWWLVGWGFYRLSNTAASETAGDGARRAALIGFIALVVALYAVNLQLLARVRNK
jgi:hypothetical protein